MGNRYKNLSEKIKELRKQLKVKTQKEFGEKLDPVILRGTIAHWETGRSEPSEKQITDMAALAEGRMWWWVLYFADDEVASVDDVDYDKNGKRIRWVTPKEWEDHMMDDAETAWYYEEKHQYENTNPEKGSFAAVLQGEPDKAPEAARNLIKSNESKGLGIASLTQAQFLVSQVQSPNGYEETDQFNRKVKYHKEAVLNFFNKTTNFDEDKFLDQIIAEGPFKYKADYFDTVSLVQIKNSQAKFMNQFLRGVMGDMLMMQRFAGKRLEKLLILCVDIDDCDTNPRLLEYVSAAKEADIKMIFTNHLNEEATAQKMVKFVLDSRNNHVAKLAQINALRSKRVGLIAEAMPPGLLSSD